MKKTDSQLLLEKMHNNPNIKLSLDIGGTLTKIVLYENNISDSNKFHNQLLSNNMVDELR